MGLRQRLRTRLGAPDAAALPPLEPEESLVAWAASGAGLVCASSLGLWWPDGDAARRIPWHLIDKATWHQGVLSIVQADVVDGLLLVDRDPVGLALPEPRNLPTVIRKRVEASIVHNEQLSVAGGTVRIVGRHVAGRDGVQWLARLDAAVRDDEQVRAALRNRIALLQQRQAD